MAFSRAVLILAAAFVLSCNHTETKKEEVREPSSVTGAAAIPLKQLEETDIAPLKAVADNQDSQRVKELLSGIRIAQILVSSFDARLAKVSAASDADQLMSSQLYCRLQEVRPLQEAIEDKLRVILASAMQNGPAGKEWFYGQLRDFAKVDTLNEIATMQIVRVLAEDEVLNCGAKNCFAAEAVKFPEFHVNPFDDEAMVTYVGTRMVQYSKVTPADLKPGTCFSETREPNQAGVYDWAHRNWIGSSLPSGQFVFTYDDGPHPSFTKEIRDTWARAGMAKPAFFWLSKNVDRLKSVVNETNSQGYVIGSHSVDHKNLGALAKAGNTKALDYEINGAVATLSKALGRPVRYFRLPYGSGVKSALIGARFQALNLEHFFWRVDSLDWQDKNPASIRNRVVAQMKAVGSGIILFHDIHPQSAKAAQLMVDYIKANPKYKAVNILDIPGLPK
ncbi:MAG: polysaccharide deacetylase family protein [Bdellovibrionales bacterium]|nr:polysaccharide deacetylase family protein [Bdellovibrionales bacterium]